MAGGGRDRSMANGLQEDANRREGDPRMQANVEVSYLERKKRALRTKISQKRYRMQYQGLDLDCAYITDRIIAIGYPSKSWEKYVRNTMAATQEFLWRRHGTRNVKVFNLRGGYLYNPKKFDSNVIYLDMKDHHPPALELMAPFCREAKAWLDADPKHVIAVHCKAGKGRTGVMICAFLIYIKLYSTPRQVLDYYSIIRTMNNQGVTIPSQRRYIYYYSRLRERNLNYFPKRMQLMAVYLERPPETGSGSTIKIKVANGSRTVFDPAILSIGSRNYQREVATWQKQDDSYATEKEDGEDRRYISARAYCFVVPEDNPIFVEGDVRVMILDGRSRFTHPIGSKKIGHVWFNTMFVCDEKFVNGDRRFKYMNESTSIGRKRSLLGSEKLMKRKDKVGNDITPNPKDNTKWKIVEPPRLHDHVPDGAVKAIYEDYGIEPPHEEIARRLYNAHETDIVKDLYNNRRLPLARTAYSKEGKYEKPTGVGGPYFVPLDGADHVLTFPVYEIDRALKDEKLNNGMKLHVVLRCLDDNNEAVVTKSDVFCDRTFAEEQAHSAMVAEKIAPYGLPTVATGAIGAEKMVQPAVLYAKDDTYTGTAHESLGNEEIVQHELAETDRWCRYYYRQKPPKPTLEPVLKPGQKPKPKKQENKPGPSQPAGAAPEDTLAPGSPSSYPSSVSRCILTRKRFTYRVGGLPDPLPPQAPMFHDSDQDSADNDTDDSGPEDFLDSTGRPIPLNQRAKRGGLFKYMTDRKDEKTCLLGPNDSEDRMLLQEPWSNRRNQEEAAGPAPPAPPRVEPEDPNQPGPAPAQEGAPIDPLQEGAPIHPPQEEGPRDPLQANVLEEARPMVLEPAQQELPAPQVGAEQAPDPPADDRRIVPEQTAAQDYPDLKATVLCAPLTDPKYADILPDEMNPTKQAILLWDKKSDETALTQMQNDYAAENAVAEEIARITMAAVIEAAVEMHHEGLPGPSNRAGYAEPGRGDRYKMVTTEQELREMSETPKEGDKDTEEDRSSPE